MNRKTITAITTPIGEGGISVIHVSGPSSIEIVGKIFRGKRIKDLSQAEDGKLYYGNIIEDGVPIDEAIINVSKKDGSFTGQDLVEINCHGGILSTRRMLDCIKKEGAVEVDGQELITESLQNGRIDSIQMEALLKIPKAKTALAAKVFLDQYKGALLTAIAECGLRNAEHTPSPLSRGERGVCSNSESRIPNPTIERLLQTAEFGIALSKPLKVTIIGSPNVGKSTLINALLGKERVIVHHEPGTTRDAVTDIFSVDGMPFELTDTAGIRHTNDIIEGLAIKETIRRLSATDIAVIVFDNSRPLSECGVWSAECGVQIIPHSEISIPHSEIIPVVNKIDLPPALNIAELQSYFSVPICQISALNGTGLLELKKRLVARFADYIKYVPGRPIVFTERQKGLLLDAINTKDLNEIEKILNLCRYSK